MDAPGFTQAENRCKFRLEPVSGERGGGARVLQRGRQSSTSKGYEGRNLGGIYEKGRKFSTRIVKLPIFGGAETLQRGRKISTSEGYEGHNLGEIYDRRRKIFYEGRKIAFIRARRSDGAGVESDRRRWPDPGLVS